MALDTGQLNGIWRVKRLMAGACEFSLQPGSVEQDTNDLATLKGDLRWCVLGERGQYNPVYASKKR